MKAVISGGNGKGHTSDVSHGGNGNMKMVLIAPSIIPAEFIVNLGELPAFDKNGKKILIAFAQLVSELPAQVKEYWASRGIELTAKVVKELNDFPGNKDPIKHPELSLFRKKKTNGLPKVQRQSRCLA